jgi:phosphoenolpyruvate carboxylase
MISSRNKSSQAFQELVVMKYKLYNGLFVTLPFAHLAEIGVELPMFAGLCKQLLDKGMTPEQIVDYFFKKVIHTDNFAKQIAILILIMQFVERQVVLFDTLEDAAFKSLHNMTGSGSLNHLIAQVITTEKLSELNKLLQSYRTRIVLTAHPTQFYPPEVLSIIRDLTHEVQNNNIKNVNDFLLQLGMTPFKRDAKPTPLDEANVIIEYLVHVFYPVLKNIQYSLTQSLGSVTNTPLPPVIELGFWPGGDRDGNPEVTALITLEVAAKLKSAILDIYLQEIQKLQHRLTFRHISAQLEKIYLRLQATKHTIIIERKYINDYSKFDDFLNDLLTLRKEIIKDDQGLFVEKVDELLSAAKTFKFHFASMDLRQDSSVHASALEKIITTLLKRKNYQNLSESEKIKLLEKLIKKPISATAKKALLRLQKKDPLLSDIIESLKAARIIQQRNGEYGLHRYIISHTQKASQVIEVLALAHLAGWSLKCLTLDIVPLFETIPDLKNSDQVMQTLYENKIYKNHLKNRNKQQTIMLGYSDGTKDGGYVTTSWEIFNCKKRLSKLTEKYKYDAIFFDGRGGPPARGGGNTYQSYRAIENIIKQKQIQLTIQGQTISTLYGTKVSAAYNIEQLFTSGIGAELFPNEKNNISAKEFKLLNELSAISYKAYLQLKDHPLFMSYLEKITPLEYYNELNVASRPMRRGKTSRMKFEELRAIPFVGAWSQMRQNIPAFYGLGTALKALVDQGKQHELQHLYQHSLFFRTLLNNAMLSLKKSFFKLTQYLKKDKEFGAFWQMLYAEAELTKKLLKRISKQKQLLENEPVTQQSIKNREEIVLPLLIIQQYALMKLRELANRNKLNSKVATIYKKIILKSLATNINANREST